MVDEEYRIDTPCIGSIATSPEHEHDPEHEKELNKNKDLGAKNAPAVSQFEEIRTLWVELFPDKPKPRSTKSITGKVKTRMSEPHFRDNWRAAMLRASRSNYVGLKDTTWFDLGWFLDNDSNYEKCLNGKYDFKPGTQRQDAPRKAKPIDCDDATEFFRGEG